MPVTREGSPPGRLPRSLAATLVAAAVLLFTAADLSAPPSAWASVSARHGDEVSSQRVEIDSIAILPFENLTDYPGASKLVADMVAQEIGRRGWRVVSGARLVDEYLAKRRIRYTGAITRTSVREMRKIFGIDAVLLGSIDLFSAEGRDSAVSINMRLVNTVDGSIMWADNLAYAGLDFQGILGLGTITSPETLSERIVHRLVAGLPDSYAVELSELSPYEIEKIYLNPKVAKGGQPIDLRVRFLSLKGELPAAVTAVIDGRQTELRRSRGGYYDAEIPAPRREGLYPVTIIARPRDSHKAFVFDAAAQVSVDTTPPDVDVSLSRTIFAPRRRGYVIFTPRLNNFDIVDEWKMEILDADGLVIRNDRGFGSLPKGLVWKGETDKRRMVDDGTYTYRFIIKDPAGNTSTVDGKLQVKNKPPDIKVDVDKVRGPVRAKDKLIFGFNYEGRERVRSWRLTINDKDGRVIDIIDGEGPLPERLDYPLKAGLDVERMTCSVSVVDSDGNVTKLSNVWIDLDRGEEEGGLIFSFRYDRSEEISAWRLAILDASGAEIDVIDGEGPLPERLEYPLKEGVDASGLSFVVTAVDKVGNPMRLTNIKVEDRVSDKLIFSFNYDTSEPIESWRISILGEDGEVLDVIDGEGPLPRQIEYPVAPGVDATNLAYSVTATDRAGNPFKLDKVKVDVEELRKFVRDKLIFSFDYDPQEKIERWQIAIQDLDGRILDIIDGKGALPSRVEYPVGRDYDLSKMAFVVTATDKAGNPFKYSKALPTILSRKRPFAELRGDGGFMMKDF